MKIKKKLRLNTLISLVIIMLMMVSLAWSFREIDRTDRNENLANEMRKAAFERIVLRDEYLLYREKRAGIQWQEKSETLRGMLETAKEHFTDDKDKTLLREVRQDFDATLSLFSRILERHIREERAARKQLVFDERESRLIGQVFLKAYALQDSIEKLYESSERATKTARNRGVVLVIFFVLGGGMAIIVNSFMTGRVMTKRLQALHEGVQIIGGGDLDYRIAAEGDDELADLASESNQMAASLKESLTSIDNLNREITDRNKAEEALRESEERYHIMMEQAADAVFLHDDTGRILDVNLKACETLGYSREELLSKSIGDIDPEAIQTGKHELWGKILSGEQFTFESRQMRKDGSFIPVEVTLGSVRLPSGPAVLGIVRNVTDRKHAEETLRQSEAKFRNLFDNAIEGVYQSTPEGRLITANMAFARMFGYESPEEIINAVTDLASQIYANPDDRKIAVGIFRDTGHLKDFECRMRRRDGSIFWVRYDGRLTKTQDGTPCFQGFIIDITDRRRAEEELRLSEEKFTKAFQSSPDAFLLTSVPDGRITEVNTGAILLSGYSLEEMLGRTTTELGLWADPAARDAYMAEVLREGQATNFETGFRIKSGAIITGLISGGIIQLRDGKCFLSVIRDISDRKRAEEKINQLNVELEQRVMDRTAQLEAVNKELEAFSYSVSHDLRAPLRSIDGFSQALLEEYPGKPLDDTGKIYLERVRKATQKMGFLIDDMLKLSRISRTEFNSEAVDLSGMVRAIVEAHQKNNPERVVDVTVQEGIMVQGDPYMMKIVLENLMDNAWKFTGKEAHPRVEFGTTARDGKTVCFIRDNGAGFDMAYVNKLFGAFQRLHTTDQFPGTGIGLSTVQRIIHRHGGRVWAQGEVGKGATFYFTLPS